MKKHRHKECKISLKLCFVFILILREAKTINSYYWDNKKFKEKKAFEKTDQNNIFLSISILQTSTPCSRDGSLRVVLLELNHDGQTCMAWIRENTFICYAHSFVMNMAKVAHIITWNTYSIVSLLTMDIIFPQIFLLGD